MGVEETVAMGNRLSKLTDLRSAKVKQLRAAQKSGSSTTKIEEELKGIDSDITALKVDIDAAKTVKQPSLAVPEAKEEKPVAAEKPAQAAATPAPAGKDVDVSPTAFREAVAAGDPSTKNPDGTTMEYYDWAKKVTGDDPRMGKPKSLMDK